jgi:hypothetical protein
MMPSLDEIIQNRKRLANEQNGLIDRLETACREIIELDAGSELPEIPPKIDVRSDGLAIVGIDFHAECAALARLVEQTEQRLEQLRRKFDALSPAEQNRQLIESLRFQLAAEQQARAEAEQSLDARIWQLEHKFGVSERGSQPAAAAMTGMGRHSSLQVTAPPGRYRHV